MSGAISESTIENGALAWLEEIGRHVVYGPDIASDVPAAERNDYAEAGKLTEGAT